MHGISLADPSEPKDKHNELSAVAPESPARERSCSPGACPGADDSHEHVPEEQHISSPEPETKRVLEPEAKHTVEPETAQGPAARQRKRPSAQRRQPRGRIDTAERAVQDMPERMTRSMARKVGVQQPRRFFGEGVSASQILRPTSTKP
ncbi:hypothetical protein IWW50_005679 [Coemansia erecta]|nr:hypothetical protein IWW50_005679 [Coemansia erecta]